MEADGRRKKIHCVRKWSLVMKKQCEMGYSKNVR